MQMYECDVVAQEADVLHETFELATLKTRLKELLMRGCNSLASLEVGSIPENIISIFCEGGSVGVSITLVPPILAHLKESTGMMVPRCVVVDREGMAAPLLRDLQAQGYTVITLLRTDQYDDLELFTEVGQFVLFHALFP